MRFSIIAVDIPLPADFPFPLRGSYEECARRAAAFGYEAIELQIQNPLDYDYAAVRKSLERYGMRASAVTTGLSYLFEGHNMSAKDSLVRAKTVERLKRQLDFARELDSQILIGFLRGRMEADDTAEQYESRLSESMYKIIEYADEIDGRICFEQINRRDGDLYNSTAETLRFIEKFRSKRLFYNADTYHMISEEGDVAAALRLAKERMSLFHVSDCGRLLPDDRHFNFRAAAAALRSIDYDGWVTIECRPVPDEDSVARDGIAYLSNIFCPARCAVR
ncbi:sugar phosphate isomerase/epimerase family protein [Cloacibacillus evryensis]